MACTVGQSSTLWGIGGNISVDVKDEQIALLKTLMKEYEITFNALCFVSPENLLDNKRFEDAYYKLLDSILEL